MNTYTLVFFLQGYVFTLFYSQAAYPFQAISCSFSSPLIAVLFHALHVLTTTINKS